MLAEQEWSLVSFEASSASDHPPRVRLTLCQSGKELTAEVSEGDGPIDAAFFAMETITGLKLVCREFVARSASLGRDAQGEVTLEVEHQGQIYRGRGVSTDTVESTLRALLDAVNRIAREEKLKVDA